MGQAVLLLVLFGAAGLLSATQAWAIAARPASRVRYVRAWLVSTAGLAMLVLLVFGAGQQKLPRDIVRTTMVLAAPLGALDGCALLVVGLGRIHRGRARTRPRKGWL
jgi:hypothetical protein